MSTSAVAKTIIAGALDGAELLDEIYAFLGRFIAYPCKAAHVGHTLWIAHVHLMDAWESTPRIAFLSPEPGSGKTRALEISELLVPRPVEAVNVTPAYLFRKVADPEGRPTILFDEIDTVFGPKAKDNEEIRGLLNAGHRRGAVAGRCVVRGKTVETEEIPAYCAVAIAGLGDLPDTILTRSVIVRMRKRAPGEHVEPYRRRVHSHEGEAIRDRLAAWAHVVEDSVCDAFPAMPNGIEDRDADVWEPLLAVADEAGGSWPAEARVAAVTLVTASKDSTPSLGVRLLSDLREVFGTADRLSTKSILDALAGLPESPWADIKGKPLNDAGLAKRLHGYGVKSKTVRIGEWTGKGYDRADLHDAWARYVPLSHHEAVTAVTPDTFVHEAEASRLRGVVSDVPHPHEVNGTGDACEHCLAGGSDADPLVEVACAGFSARVHEGCIEGWAAAARVEPAATSMCAWCGKSVNFGEYCERADCVRKPGPVADGDFSDDDVPAFLKRDHLSGRAS